MASDVKEFQTDDKGRTLVEWMTDRELAEETCERLRQLADGIEQFSAFAKDNPMMKNLLGM